MVTFKTAGVMILAASAWMCGCGSSPAPVKASAPPPAKVDNRVKESDLTRVTLAPEAEKRLGIELAPVSEQTASNQVQIAGDVMAIPGKALIVGAPASGTVVLASKEVAVGQVVRNGQPIFRLTPMLTPQRDLKTTYEADLQSAKSRLDTAKLQLERAQQLLRDMAGSKRNVELAEQEFGQAKAAHDAAQERLNRLETHPLDADVQITIAAPFDSILRQILAADGQNVSAGAALFEVADLRLVWLRVPVYSGDLKDIVPPFTIVVRDIDGGGPVFRGRRVNAPPTADPLAVTSDLYFEIPNTNLHLRPGQRLTAILPTQSTGRKGLAVPLSAILYDVHGGTWVYVNDAPHVYRRARVELAATIDGTAFLSRGVAPGLNVVVQGATELFGTEFGAGH
jgi:cobalt-zinc-cadmium efflux system membrane fusion protein